MPKGEGQADQQIDEEMLLLKPSLLQKAATKDMLLRENFAALVSYLSAT